MNKPSDVSMKIENSAIRREITSVQRGRGFFSLAALLAFLSMFFFLWGASRGKNLELSRYLNIYSWLLLAILSLTQWRGWAWEQAHGRHLLWLSFPLKDHQLIWQFFLSGIQQLLWLLIPALLVSLSITGVNNISWLPGIIALFLEGSLIISLYQALAMSSSHPVRVLILVYLLGGGYLFLLPLTTWNLQLFFTGYLRGSSLVLHLLLIMTFLFIQLRRLLRLRSRG
ncbi:MAG: hypothetical protein PF447_05925 [Spirochaetaceae bacterium]|jgi:hypothetical protein|nr:hypothetical protein [Spirochaetaceae bacterium]